MERRWQIVELQSFASSTALLHVSFAWLSCYMYKVRGKQCSWTTCKYLLPNDHPGPWSQVLDTCA